MSLPTLTRDQVRRVDAVAIHELGIPGIVLMENAGRNAADRIDEIRAARGGDRVVVVCGPGNNGGDGFVITRHLLNRGVETRVYLAGEAARLTPDAGTNHRILKAMGVAIAAAGAAPSIRELLQAIRPSDVVVDALLGTGFHGAVREPLASLINGLNAVSKTALVAVDVPSGLDCDTGQPCNATIRATQTVTFVANKVGFRQPGAAAYTGDVTVADIGAPPSLVARLSG